MNKEKRRVPKLRFPGFTEDWEQRKLGDFTNQINTFVNPEDAKLPLWSLTAEAGLIEKSDRYERDFLVKKKNQFKRIETNTLVYNPMNITIGSIDIYTGLYPIAVSGYYVSIVYDKNIDTDFLKEVLLLPSSLKMYKNYATGSLIERQRVQYPTFSKLQLLLPNLDEQKAIGQLFKSLNLNITLHQRKLEHLNLKKKALLQKLFPKNGERYPELRFPGFTDAWEQRKFGDLFEYERPDAYIVKSDNYNNDFNMPVLTANKAFILGYTNEENSYNKPSIIFDDFTLDRKYVDFPYMLKSSAIKILTSKNQHNLRFLFERLNSTRFEVLGHARHYISVVQNTTTLCPSVDEEVCISNLLTKFDELITLHQRKLEHLQLQKKALLQQMFV